MKQIRLIGMALVAVLMSFCFTACSSDDDDNDISNGTNIVGSWKQTNSAGTVITLTFNSNKTGMVTYVYYDDNNRQTGSATENFEYIYNSTENEVKIYGDTQIEGDWDVTITATMLILEGGGHQYRFTKA